MLNREKAKSGKVVKKMNRERKLREIMKKIIEREWVGREKINIS